MWTEEPTTAIDVLQCKVDAVGVLLVQVDSSCAGLLRVVVSVSRDHNHQASTYD